MHFAQFMMPEIDHGISITPQRFLRIVTDISLDRFQETISQSCAMHINKVKWYSSARPHPIPNALL